MSSFMFSFYFSHKNRLVFLFIIFVRRFLFICFYLFFTLCFLAQYVLPVVIIYHSRRLILTGELRARVDTLHHSTDGLEEQLVERNCPLLLIVIPSVISPIPLLVACIICTFCCSSLL